MLAANKLESGITQLPRELHEYWISMVVRNPDETTRSPVTVFDYDSLEADFNLEAVNALKKNWEVRGQFIKPYELKGEKPPQRYIDMRDEASAAFEKITGITISEMDLSMNHPKIKVEFIIPHQSLPDREVSIGEKRRVEIEKKWFDKLHQGLISPEVAGLGILADLLEDGFNLGEMGIDLDMPAPQAEEIIKEKESSKLPSKV